jgi:shikimate kinase
VKAVALVGFMGAGKTTVGRALGKQLGWTFEDLDDRIERREQRKVAEIFRDSGESSFRRAEHAALKELLEELKSGPEKIVAVGGGAFAEDRNARLIQSAGVPTIFLEADPEELWRRCSRQAEQDGIERPLLKSLETFRELYEARRPHYMKASLRQSSGGKTAAQIAKAVVLALGLSPRRRGEKQ